MNQAWSIFPNGRGQDFDSHAVEPAALPTLGWKAPTGRLSEHAAQSERATRTFGLWGYGGLSSDAAKLSRRPTFGPFIRIQPELSLWPGLTDKTSHSGMAASDAVCWHRSELNCIASVSMSSWMHDEEESQERIWRSDTCEHHERNGEAAHDQIRTRRGSESSRWANHAG